MATQQVIDGAGTPLQGYVYGVFDSDQEASRAEQGLTAAGFQPQRLHTEEDAQALQSPDESAGLMGKLGRLIKRIGGESHEAERYANHLQQGRIVLAFPVSDRSEALRASSMMVEHGGYDVTYFGDWAIEYMSTDENLRRGMPTHSLSNLDE